MTRTTLTLLIGSSFCGGLAGNWLWVTPGRAVVAQSATLPAAPAESSGPATLDNLAPVIARVAPSVVTVDSVQPAVVSAGYSTNKPRPTEDSGSGVLVRLEGVAGVYVFTNNHVVGTAKAAGVTVTLADGRIVQPLQLWADPESDIAILKLPLTDLPTLEFADSDRVQTGQWVLAFGSPFGLQQTVTHGIISARNRGKIRLGDTIRIKEFLQTDAPINPGNSGGPLVDLSGRLIGINTAIATSNGANSGISFSIPANLARRIARELLSSGVVSRGYIGLELAPTLEPATALRLGLTRVWGALIESVRPGGPASDAGLLAGDVILQLNDIEIRDENHLINLVSGLPANQQVTLTVWRAKKLERATVTIGDWRRAIGS